MTGAMGCLTVVMNVAFVCRLAFLVSWLTRFPSQAAGPSGVPAWSIPRAKNAFNICRAKALLSRVRVKDLVPTVWSMAALPFAVMVGSCRYVEFVCRPQVKSTLNRTFRSGTAQTSAHAIAFVGMPLAIALPHGVANLVRLHRSGAKSSWRRTALKAFLDPSKCYIVDLALFLYRPSAR